MHKREVSLINKPNLIKMKKFLLILCALVCGTLAFAQTGTYTDNLHLTINGDDDGVVKSTVSIEYIDEANGIIAFTLHDFYVDVYIGEWLTIKLGDLTVYDIQLGDEVDGVAEFSCTDNSNVAYPDADPLYSMFISDVSVNMTGEVSETKLRARMDITVKILGALSYPITATFGYDYEYLVVNAQTGNYLGGGLDWGTHATELGKPQFFLFTDQLDGTYTLFGNQGGTSIGWDVDYAGLYIDAVNPLTWEIIETDGGVYIATDEGYLTGNGFQEAVTLEHSSSSSAVWKLVTKDEIIATMADASVDNPVDVTPLIPAPEPKRNDWGSSWVATGYNTSAVPDNYSLGQDYSTANCAESYHSKNGFDIRQAIPDLPTGYYTLSAQAFYRNEGGTVVPVMYIDNAQYELPVLTTNANSMEEAYQEFLRELHTITADFYVGEDDEEVTVGFASLTTDDDGMWTIFGELGLTYTGSQPRTLQLVEGIMNVDVEAEMKAAIEAYNTDPTSENFSAAQVAIAAAEESVAYYSEITDAIDSGDWEATYNGFDAAGQAAFDNGFLAAYEARTLTNESLDEGLATACKQQTTAGKDITLAMDVVDWTNATGNYQTGRERYATDNYTADEGNILYQHIDGLVAGATYEVSFYAAANSTSDRGFDNIYGDDIAQAFANELADAVTVVDQTACTIVSADNLHTFTVTVGDDAVLEYGLQNIGTGGNWYVCQAVSLIIVAVEGEEPEPESSAYVFVCTDWGSIDLGRVSDDNVTYDETNNTITVVASGTNNVALSNGREAPFTTADMTVTNKQCWYTVVGTNISTADGDSRLWWMNGANWGEWDPTVVVELDDGQVLVTWDLSTMTEIDVNLLGDENHLDGWTGFGVTSTTGTSVISDINFYTTEEIDVLTGGVATSIDTVETAGTELAKDGIYTLSGMRVSKAVKGVYIVDGKKVLVK